MGDLSTQRQPLGKAVSKYGGLQQRGRLAKLLVVPVSLVLLCDYAYSASVHEGCATEISMFCAGRKDLTKCLGSERNNLTPRCLDALSGRSSATAAESSGKVQRAEAMEPPAGAVSVPGAGNVWFEAGYSGPKTELLASFQAAIGDEIPGALRLAAKLVGQPGYADGFARPVTVRIEYDPTQRNGLGGLDAAEREGGGLRLTFNMAHWEDCPSRAIMKSVVIHEFTHAVLHDMLGNGELTFVPQWFDEGLAMLAGGEPSRSITLDAAYARHGRDYPGALHCPFSNEGYGLAGVGLLTDCYPIYLLAVERLSESSPEALSGIIKDLRSGIPMESAVPARAGLGWSSFIEATVERTHKVIGGKSVFAHLTGKGWWRQIRWCR